MSVKVMAATSWRSEKLRNLPIQIIDGDRSARYPKRDELQQDGVLFLNTTNINQNRLDLNEANFVTPEKFAQIKKGRLQRLDIVITTRGSVGKVALFDCNHSTGLINAQMLILRADGESLDHKFLFYITCSDNFQGAVRNFASGSAQPQIPIQDLREIEIRFPSLRTQQKIAAILSAYDDLIENNMRRIKILEEMAQALYREWFVHFRFPGHEKVKTVDSPLGKIPQGWKVRRVKDILKRLKSGMVYTEADVAGSGLVPVIDQSRNSFLGFHNNEPDHLASPGKPIIIFGDHTCKMELMVEPFSIGPNVVPFISENSTPILFLYFLIHNLVETKEYKRHWTELTSKEVVLAPNEYAKMFSGLVTPLFEQIDSLTKKNLILRRTRDLVLPKLISSEVDVNDASIGEGS